MEKVCLRRLTVVTLVLMSGGNLLRCKGQCPDGWRNFQNSSCYLHTGQTAQWTNARKACANLGGDIVKINSSVENSFVTKLMSRSSWIGIFRDMTTGAKDFIWSDWSKIVYSNWANGEPNNWNNQEACGELSPNGKWNDNNCLSKFPYICKKGVDWCLVNNGGCPHKCTNVDGKAVCSCRRGYASLSNGTICTDLKSALTKTRNWEIGCIVATNRSSQIKNNSVTCPCPLGYSSVKTGNIWTCRDFNECINGDTGCQQSCVNSAGSYKCLCKQGFLLKQDRKTCTALENVLTNNSSSSWEVKCNRSCWENCGCRPGFKVKLYQNVSTCIDVDECMINNGGCQHTCANTAGSYKCSCRVGFIVDQDGRSCKDLARLMNGVSGLLTCTSGILSACKCKAGYQARRLGPIWACFDVDECSLGFSNGGCDHVCVNTPGNYSCVCRDGYIKLQQGRICKGSPPTEASSTVSTISTIGSTSDTSTKSATEQVGTLCPATGQLSTTPSSTTDEPKPTPKSVKRTGGQESSLCQDQTALLKVLIGCTAVLIVIVCSAILYFCLVVSRMRRNWSVESSNQDSIKGQGITFVGGNYNSPPEFVNPVYDETFAGERQY